MKVTPPHPASKADIPAPLSKMDLSAPAPATSFTRFLDLPPELRTMIYTSYFSLHAGEMFIHSPPGPVPPPKPERAGPANLLLTNHLIHDEALASYLQTTRFCFESPLDLSYFFHRYIYHRHHVRRIIFSAFLLVGPQRCFWPMRVWREQRTIDVLVGLEREAQGRIRGVVREL